MLWREESRVVGKGEDYQLLTETIAITITDFVMFSAKEMPEVVNKFNLRAEAGRVYSDDLELVFAELPKFDKSEKELKTDLDRWFYFLKSAGDLTAIPGALQVEPAIVHAFEIANKCGLSPEELDDQERREIFIQDQRGAITLAEQRGKQHGMQQERLRIAEGLLDLIDNDALIAEKTGLSVETVGQLRRRASQGAS